MTQTNKRLQFLDDVKPLICQLQYDSKLCLLMVNLFEQVEKSEYSKNKLK